MSDKCPKCGLPGDASKYPKAIMHPPEKGSSRFGKPDYVDVHIIDSPACLRRQLAQRATTITDQVAEIKRLREVLRGIEWPRQTCDRSPYCPMCGGLRHDGHKPDCALDAALYPSKTDTETPTDLAWLALDALAEIDRLRAIVDKLPTDKNGAPFVDGGVLWFVFSGEIVSATMQGGSAYVAWQAHFGPEAQRRTLKAPVKVYGADGYSTQEAAEQARQEKEKAE